MALRKERSLTRAKIVGKRRSKMRIIADILRHAQRSAKKTHIMYECNLSFNQLKRYLNFLRKRALIRRKIENGSIIYKTTDNGKEFLKKYSSIAQQLRPPALERSLRSSESNAELKAKFNRFAG